MLLNTISEKDIQLYAKVWAPLKEIHDFGYSKSDIHINSIRYTDITQSIKTYNSLKESIHLHNGIANTRHIYHIYSMQKFRHPYARAVFLAPTFCPAQTTASHNTYS